VSYNLRIRSEQLHKWSGKYETYKEYEDSIYYFKNNTGFKAFDYSVVSSSAFVLCHHCCHSVCNILLGCICIVINSVYYCKCGWNRNAHSVNNSLYSYFTKLYSSLLHSRCPAVAYSFLKQWAVKYKPLLAKTQNRYFEFNIYHTEYTAESLAHYSCNCTSIAASFQDNNKEKVTKYI